MKCLVVALAAILVASPVSAFISRGPTQVSRPAETVLFLEPGALTEYMAKAHEDKLKAVKDAEKKKNTEIQVISNFGKYSVRICCEFFSPAIISPFGSLC